jgi:hypothetical protein
VDRSGQVSKFNKRFQQFNIGSKKTTPQKDTEQNNE